MNREFQAQTVRLVRALALGLCGFLVVAGCAGSSVSSPNPPPPSSTPPSPVPPSPTPPGPPSSPPPGARPNFGDVQSWTYQLNTYTNGLGQIAASGFQLAVVDYASDGSGNTEWTPAAVVAARQKRWMLAYLSIGEAEDYRAYWQSGWKVGSPAWIKNENPNWKGNYLVEYWNPEWQTIILAYLDKIIAQGFDGAYLDLVDAYQSFNGDSRQKMVDWVCRISQYARAKNPNFKIVPQNASELIYQPGYAACVDATGNEETWFNATDKATSSATRQAQLKDYAEWRRLGKPVFLVDYARQAANIDSAYTQTRSNGYVEYVTDVDLNVMRVNAGFDPPGN